MSLLILNMPTESSQMIAWLERHVTGLNLLQLVNELTAIHQPASRVRLTEVCGDQLADVLLKGLSVLSSAQISQLLLHPETLLELQDEAFVHGSEYWSRLCASGDAGLATSQTPQNVLTQLKLLDGVTLPGAMTRTLPEHPMTSAPTAVAAAPAAQPVPATVPVTVADLSRHSSPGRRFPLRTVVSGLTVAAVLLFLLWPTAPQPAGWGFSRTDALTASISGQEFLDHLSVVAGEWFRKEPQNAEDLEIRLTQFSAGCQSLLDAPLQQLDEQQRTWLRGKCRLWKDKIDGHVAALKANPQAFDEVRTAANQTVNNLILALKKGPEATA